MRFNDKKNQITNEKTVWVPNKTVYRFLLSIQQAKSSSLKNFSNLKYL